MNDNDGTGLFRDMPNDEHHRRTAIGSSGLKLLKRSPLHFWVQYLDPQRDRDDDSKAKRVGRAWHTAIFEPEAFGARYRAKPDVNMQTTRAKLLYACLSDPEHKERLVSIPDGIKGSKEGKRLIAELEADRRIPVEDSDFQWIMQTYYELAGFELLPADDIARVLVMAEAAREHPIGRALFAQPLVCEASIFTRDRETGVLCKIRPDCMIEPSAVFPNGLIVDGKSTEDASAQGFARSVWNYDYALQAAWYVDRFQEHYGTAQPPGFIWMAQEKDLPQATAFYSAGADVIDYGRRQYRALLRVYAACLERGEWPGYPPQVTDLAMPAWAQKAMQEAA